MTTLTLRQARTRAGLTQDALARRSRVSQAQISALEAGSYQPRATTLYRLARALGVNPRRLRFGQEPTV